MVRAIDNNSIHKYSADTILMVACSGTHLCGINYTVLNVSAWGVACSSGELSSEMQCDHSHRTDLITSLSCIQHTLVTATHRTTTTTQYCNIIQLLRASADPLFGLPNELQHDSSTCRVNGKIILLKAK